VLRGYAHHRFLSAQIAALAAERRALLHTSKEASIEPGRQWMQLKGIGINGAWALVRKFFAWRKVQTLVARRREHRVTGVQIRTDRRLLETRGANTTGSRQTDRGDVTQRLT
jgi:hypothetical protein